MQPRRRPGAHPLMAEKVVVGASGFTSLWALTWFTSASVAVAPAIQGGFAVGGVMATSGLAMLWWKTRTVQAVHDEDQEEEREGEAAASSSE